MRRTLAIAGIVMLLGLNLAFGEDRTSDEERVLRIAANALKDIKALTPVELRELSEGGEEEHLIVSIQPHEEFILGHVPGAVHLSVDYDNLIESVSGLPKDKCIVVVSSNGHHSSLAATMLNQMGYEAYTLSWGFAGWNYSSMDAQAKMLLTKGFCFEVTK